MLILFFAKCADDKAGTNDPRGSLYAGTAACVSCHKGIADSYIHNQHFNASAKADYNYIACFINDTNNITRFTNDEKVVLTKKDSLIYQTFYSKGRLERSAVIDVAFGAAVKAQTYGYWKDSQLFQLPLTYLTNEKIWTNSPGFPIEHPYFTRPVISRCLECHTSFAQVTEKRDGHLLQTKQVYNKASIIYGIDCERCHGPGAQHTKFQQENPGVKQAKFITSIKSLSRQQQLDVCGACHSGDPVKLQSVFNFVPGNSLANYYIFYNAGSGEPDVHGMQAPLLALSKCFKQSEITCTTCHSPHQQQQGIQAFAAQCSSCHQQVKHTTNINAGNNNCITCHMPLRASKSLDFNNQAQQYNIQYMLRTHRIAVYPATQWQ